ncbi:hypothetical protein GCM10025868_02240 [Angustibacter aerolatus]|uniref:AMP-dependent synthetase/ligase domain-containing protein n=1 Tax=Angustibacter aerolatus TaxID=1162965 RepID=A0ABQ6JB04_9ACTN|nr:hypothetical protein GCM10025868_02240 [Angustibacter aerolatus]
MPPRPRSRPRTWCRCRLADACDLADAGGLPALRLVVVAGAGLGAGLRERAVRHGWRVLEYYGAAEPVVRRLVGRRRPDARRAGRRGRACATSAPPAPESLWVRSPYIATSGPALRLDGRGWATVGDRAVSDGDGWRVLGRGDLAVQTGGHTVPVEEVERVLEPVAGTGHLAVVGLPHPRLGQRVTAVVVVGSRSDAEPAPPARRRGPHPARRAPPARLARRARPAPHPGRQGSTAPPSPRWPPPCPACAAAPDLSLPWRQQSPGRAAERAAAPGAVPPRLGGPCADP